MSYSSFSPSSSNPYESTYSYYGIDNALRETVNFHLSWNKERKELYESSNKVVEQNTYKGLGGDIITRDKRDLMKKVSSESLITSNLSPQEEILRALSRNAFSSFSQDIYDLSVSGTKVINRVIGNYNIGLDKSLFADTLSEEEQDRRREEWERYVTSEVYENLFKHDTTQTNEGRSLYGGLHISKSPGWIDTNQWGGDRETIAKGNWLMNNILTSEEVNLTKRVSQYHQELLRSSVDSYIDNRYGRFTDVTERVRDISNQFLMSRDYISKPGIKSAIAFIESADRELTIDLFQLQNKAVVDVLISKLERESSRIAKGEFKFQLRLAGPTNSDRRNMTGLQILGPNVIAMERLYNLQKRIIEQQFNYDATLTSTDKLTISEEDKRLSINEKIAKLLPSFTIEMMTEGMYHPKVYTSDKYAMLGSFNLTSPVGNSVIQAGSNYEEIIIFHNRLNNLIGNIPLINDQFKVIDTFYRSNPSNISQSIREIGSIHTYGLTDKDDSLHQYVDTHLYLQTRLIALSGIKGKGFTGGQIGMAGDIGQGLRSILSYAKGKPGLGRHNKVEVYMNLNQVWLLQYDNDLYYGKKGDYTGEFGPIDRGKVKTEELLGVVNEGSRRSIYRGELQENLFDLLINNQAYISVDIRNYRERVLEPMTEKVQYLLGKQAVDGGGYRPKEWNSLATPTLKDFSREDLLRIGSMVFETEYNSNLTTLTSKNNSNESLERVLGLNDNGVNYRDSVDELSRTYGKRKGRLIAKKGVDRTVKQLIAMTRGNIIGVTEAMSHVKNVFAIEKEGQGINDDTYRHIGSISGSSNFGSESLMFRTNDIEEVSSEVGVIALGREVRRKGQREGILYRRNENVLSEDIEDFYAQQGTDKEREWRRLTQTTVGNVETNLNSTRASWESRVNARGLSEITARVKQLNKDIGVSNAISIQNIYGQGGGLIALELTVNVNNMIGDRGFNDTNIGYNPIKFRVTNLQGGMGGKGFVYLIDQNKVIGNSIFVNNTDEDIKGIPYGEGSFIRNVQTGEYELNTKTIKSKASMTLSPIESLMNMVSTLSSESLYRTLVHEPFNYMKELKSSQYDNNFSRLGMAGLSYLEYLSRGHIDGGENSLFLLDISDHDLSKLIHTFESKHLNTRMSGVSKRALELTGGSIYEKIREGKDIDIKDKSKQALYGDPDLALRKGIINNLTLLKDINRKLEFGVDLSSQERMALSSIKLDIVNAIKETFDRYMGLESISSFQSDIALGILESRRDFLYTSKLQDDIKEVQRGLLEAYITQSQASTYGTSQAWLKTPLYGINNNQRTFINKLNEVNPLFRYALAQPFIFNPSSTTGKGTEGAIRGVAAGGSVSESRDYAGGLLMYGINKTPIGDITSVQIASFAGVGYITTRSQYESHISELLFDEYKYILLNFGITTQEHLLNTYKLNSSTLPSFINDKFNELIDMTPFRSTDVNESINYTFNTAKKASQIPQRLKNVLGGRPMFELDRDISYTLVTKGNVSGLINKKVYDIKLDLLSHMGKKHSHLVQEVISTLKQVIENNPNHVGLLSNDRLLEEALLQVKSNNPQVNITSLFKEIKGLWIYVENTVGSDINVTVINNSGLRSVLNNEMVTILENYKKELSEEFGFTEGDFLPGSTSIARKLLLTRARLADTMTGGIKGFTGSREGFDPIVLVQLTGDYSDYAWANPLYGTDKGDREYVQGVMKSVDYKWDRLDRKRQAEVIGRMGTMSGFIEKAEKRQKSSKLSEDWSHKGVKLANKGDIVTFDERSNRVLVWGSMEEMMKEGGGTPRQILNIDKYSNEVKLDLTKAVLGDSFDAYYTFSDVEDRYVVKSVMDSRNQVGTLTEVIDNFRTIDDLPNVSKLDRQSWNRASENSVEFILDSKQLMANADNNQLLWEMVYLRATLVGGGKRIEGTGGLPKAVLKFTGLEEIYETPNGNTDFFSFLTHQLNQHKGGSIQDIDPGQVFGLFSPSNLKSYFYSHGSTIIRNKKYLQGILGDLETKKGGITGKGLILSLMLGFGDSWLDKNSPIKKEIYTTLFESAIKGDLGEWFRNQALTSVLSGISNDEYIKNYLDKLNIKEDISRLKGIFDVNSPIYQESSQLRSRLGELFAKSLFSKSSDLFNAQQTPSLKLIDNDLILKALKGDIEGTAYIKSFLRKRLLETVGEKGNIGLTRKDFIRIDDAREREAALLAASIDLVEQLKNQGSGVEVPTEIDYSNDRIIQQLAYIMGDTDLDKIQLARDIREKKTTLDNLTKEEEDALNYLEVTRAILRGYTHKSTVLRMFIGPMASQSKESVGSKHTGSLEYQHLLKPMMTIVSSFEQTGSIASLRKVVANMMSVVAEGSTMTGLDTDLAVRGFNTDKKIYSFTDIRLANQTMKSKFIGLYAGYSSFNNQEMNKVRQDYQKYGELTTKLVRQYIENLSKTKNKDERISIIRSINDLLIVNPDYDDLYTDTITNTVNERYTKAERIKDILYHAFNENGLGLNLEEYGLKTHDDIDILVNSIASGKLQSIGREQQLDPNKPFGVGSVSPILDNLDYKGFSFAVPMIYLLGSGEEDSSGRVRLEIDNSDLRYSYLMGGDELKAVGDSYGSFVDELVAKSLTIASAFTPGTLMSNIREKMVLAQISGNNEISLDKEEMIALRHFYSAAIGEVGIVKTMAEASTGTRIQGMLAHKTRYPGAVSSPAASWMVPAGHMLLAQEALRRYAGMSPIREDMVNQLTSEMNSLDPSNPLLSLDRRIYSSAITAYKQGVSQTGFSIINTIYILSDEFNSLDRASPTYKDDALLIASKLQEVIDNNDIDKNSGDSLGINLARKQRVLIDIAIGNIDPLIKENVPDYTSQIEHLTRKISDISDNIETLLKTKDVVDNLINSGLYSQIKDELASIKTQEERLKSFSYLDKDNKHSLLIEGVLDDISVRYPSTTSQTKDNIATGIYEHNYKNALSTQIDTLINERRRISELMRPSTLSPEDKALYDAQEKTNIEEIERIKTILKTSSNLTIEEVTIYEKVIRDYQKTIRELDSRLKYIYPSKEDRVKYKSEIDLYKKGIEEINKQIDSYSTLSEDDKVLYHSQIEEFKSKIIEIKTYLKPNSGLSVEQTKEYLDEIKRYSRQIDEVKDRIISSTSITNRQKEIYESQINKFQDEIKRVKEILKPKSSISSIDRAIYEQERAKSIKGISDTKSILESNRTISDDEVNYYKYLLDEYRKELVTIQSKRKPTSSLSKEEQLEYNRLLDSYNREINELSKALDTYKYSPFSQGDFINEGIIQDLRERRKILIDIFKNQFSGVLSEDNVNNIDRELDDLPVYQKYLEEVVSKYRDEINTINQRITVLNEIESSYTSKFNKNKQYETRDELIKGIQDYDNSSLFSSLRNVINNKELLEGSYKGKVSSYSFDRDTFLSGLSNDMERREMFSFVLGEMKGGFSEVIEELILRDKRTFNISEAHQGITKTNREQLGRLIEVLDIISDSTTNKLINIEALDKINALGGKDSAYSVLGTSREAVEAMGGVYKLEGKEGLSKSISLLESAMNSMDISDSLEVLGFRSPPVGGSEQQRMTLGLIKDIGLLNEYSRYLEGNTATFDSSIRNKGLSLVTPISFLTMNLGDFDGDQYTTIFSQFMDVQRNIQKSNILIKKKEMDISRLETSLAINPQDEEVLSKISSLRSQVDHEKSKIADYNSQMNIWKENLNASEFTKATKKEVANFLGIRKEMLMSTSEGGYQKVSPSLDLVFTEIYFGRDLFGGMEDTLSPSNQIKGVLSTIFNQANDNNETLLSLLSTNAEQQKLDQTLVSSLESIVRNERDKANESTYMSLLMVDDEARRTIIDTVKDSLNSYLIPINEKGKGQEQLDNDVILSHAASSFYSRYRGLPGLQSVLAQGAGVNMTLGSYDSMVKVMGEAGGVVLGKTYNTFISTLYTDSPLLALNHVLKDEGTRALLNQAGFFDKNKEVTGEVDITMDEDRFYKELNKSTQQSESILSFIKSINQLLRDGIKPKGGSKFLDEMKEFESQYEALNNDPKAQQLLIKEKASFFGPSGSNVGMSAFMELSELINKRNELSARGYNNLVRMDSDGNLVSPWEYEEFADNQSILRKEFGIDESEFNVLSKHLMDMYGKETVSAFDVAALKTQRNMETIIVAYRYNTDTGGQVYEKGTQKGFMETIKRGTIGYMESQGLYNPAIDERANLQNYIDSKFDERTAEGSKNLYILQQMFGKDREDIRRNYLDISSSGLQNEVLSMIEILSTTTSMTTGMMGKAGEGLSRFTSLEGARQEAVSVIGGRSDSSIHPGMGSDIWTSLINLAGNNKLSSHAIPVVFEAFSSNESLFSLYETGGGKGIEGLIPSLLSGLTVTGKGKDKVFKFATRGGNNADNPQEAALRLMIYRILDEGQNIDVDVPIGEGNEKVKKNLTKYILDKLETTATIAKGRALMELMDKLYGKKNDAESYLNGNNFVEGVINRNALLKEERLKLQSEISSEGLSSKQYEEKISNMANERVNAYINKLRGDYESAMIEFMYASQEERRKVKNNRLPQEINKHENFDYMNVIRNETNANKLSNIQDFIIPVAFTLLGSAIIGGRLDREVIGDVVGSSLIAASMSKGNILSSMLSERIAIPEGKGSNVIKGGISAAAKAVGSSFKLNMALQETDGDLSEALALTAGRELGFAFGSMVLAPMVEKGLTDSFFHMSHMMRGQRELFEKAKLKQLSKEDKLMYMLGGTKGALDSDDYIRTKGTALTATGAILSGVLGMFMEGINANIISSMQNGGQVNDFAVIDQALDSLNDSITKNHYLSSQRETSPDLFNEEGNYVYTDEISPLDAELSFNSIDTDFMDIDLLESQVTSDDQYELFIA